MTITPFSSLRAGATVTPVDPNATGSFDIQINAGGKGTAAYLNADRVLSGLFWPVDPGTAPGSPVDNMVTVCLSGAGTQSVDAHQNWYCYGGWNLNGLDPDGVTVASAPKHPVSLAVYNGTPYTMVWGIFDRVMPNHDAMMAYYPAARLTPGSSMVIEGVRSTVYYSNTADVVQGVTSSVGNSYLHMKALPWQSYYVNSSTKYYHSGYLQVVITQSPLAGVVNL